MDVSCARFAAKPGSRAADGSDGRPASRSQAPPQAIAIAGVIVADSGNGSRVVRASIGAASVRISGQRAELIVAHLPRAPAGRTYEIWLQDGSAPPRRSTLFNLDPHAGRDVAVAGSVHGVRRLLVTEEPAGGTSAPTASPVIVASIG